MFYLPIAGAVVTIIMSVIVVFELYQISKSPAVLAPHQEVVYRGAVLETVPLVNPAFEPVPVAPHQEVVYRGAVLETVPLVNPALEPVEYMLESIRNLSEYARLAKEQEVDIIVFPEATIYSYAPKDRPSFIRYTQYVPDVGLDVAPCDFVTPINHDEVVREMSCTAKALNMYVVLNLPERVDCTPEDDPDCPADHHYFFNLNVVYDRKGVIISKYRKLHLFIEPVMNVGNKHEQTAIFTTDFGVTFTQHICFDLLFYRPSLSNIDNFGIHDVIMPTSWVDYLPFVTAPQAQYGWSRGAGVNLLVAGRHIPERAAVGSGIYTGFTDITNSIYIYDDTVGTTLLVHDVTTTASVETLKLKPKPPISPLMSNYEIRGGKSVSKVSSTHYFLNENLQNYSSSPIVGNSTGTMSGIYSPPGQTRISIKYDINWTLNGDGDYFLLFKSGVVGFGEYLFYNQVGALLYCADGLSSCGKVPFQKPNKATFEYLNLTLQFHVLNVIPAILDQNFQLVGEDRWHYEARKEEDKHIVSIIITEPLDFIFSIAVIGRWFNKDPFCDKHLC